MLSPPPAATLAKVSVLASSSSCIGKMVNHHAIKRVRSQKAPTVGCVSRPSEPLRPHAPVQPRAPWPALATAMPREPKPLLAAESGQRTTAPCRATKSRRSGMGGAQVNPCNGLDTCRISCQSGRNAHRACHTSHRRINRSLERAKANRHQALLRAVQGTSCYGEAPSPWRRALQRRPLWASHIGPWHLKGWLQLASKALASPWL